MPYAPLSEQSAALPPLTDDERYRFMAQWLGRSATAKLRALPDDAEALRWLMWQRDNGGGSGPSGWQYGVEQRGRVAVVLKVVPDGATPNKYGTLMGVAARGAIIRFEEIVRFVRHGRPTAQLSLFAEVTR